MRHGKYPFIIGFLIAPVALYVTFVVYPYIEAFRLSLTNWKGVSPEFDYVGLQNYERLLDYDVFWKAVQHHGFLLITLPLITIILALFFSFMINVGGGSSGGEMKGVWGSKFYRVVFFFPQVLAVVIIGVIFGRALSPDESGLINGFLDNFGVDPIMFMVEGDLALWSILGVLIWQAVGFYVVLFSAALASVPKDIYEAATIDGASRVTVFFKVSLPLVWDTIQVAWVYLGIAAFDAFALVMVMSIEEGGPDKATTVLGLEIYKTGILQGEYAFACTMGVALFFMTITFAALTLRVTRREAVEL